MEVAEDEVVSLKKFREMFGVCYLTTLRWRKRGLLPFHKKGNVVFFTWEDINTFLERMKQDRNFFRHRWGPFYVVRDSEGNPAEWTARTDKAASWAAFGLSEVDGRRQGYRAEKMWIVEQTGDVNGGSKATS